MKKIIAILIFLLVLSGCQKKQLEDIYVIYTNDVHCNLDGDMNYATLAAYKKQLQSEHKYVVLVDSGDYSQGKPIGGLTKGSSIIEIMNKVPYDIAAIGNHEFDYGMPELKQNIDLAEFEVVLSNAHYSGENENLLKDVKPYVIKDFDGTKVAFIGVSTPLSLTSSTPNTFKENGETVYDFGSALGADVFYGEVQSNIDEVKKAGAKYVVLLSHLGTTDAYKPYGVVDVIENTKGIDVALDAHEHAEIIGDKVLNKEGKEVLLTSTGTGLTNIGQLIIKTDGTFETTLISGLTEKDEDVQNFINEKSAAFDEYLNTVIGKTDYDLTISDGEYRVVRSRETNIADLVADAYKWYFDAQIGLVQGGGVRVTVSKGDITIGNCLSVLPFSNELTFVKATGQMIADALEYSSKQTLNYIGVDGKAEGEFGGFLQVSGLKYTIDTSITPSIEVDGDGMMVSIGDTRRVKDIMVLENDTYVPLEMDKEYTVAGVDYFIKQGGDGQTGLKDSAVITQGGAVDVNVLVKYIEEELGGIIPAKYETTEGRIRVE